MIAKNLSRRGLLGGILAAGLAPVIIRSGILMPIKPGILTTAGTFNISDFDSHDLHLAAHQRWLEGVGQRMLKIGYEITVEQMRDLL